jgi:hypothetical protein
MLKKASQEKKALKGQQQTDCQGLKLIIFKTNETEKDLIF